MPKKHRQRGRKPKVVWERQETPDAAERLAAAFDMLFSDTPSREEEDGGSEQWTLP